KAGIRYFHVTGVLTCALPICLLALLVAERLAAARAPDGVELVDEHDARRMAARLLEQLADARRAHAREHLDEIRSAGEEERHAGDRKSVVEGKEQADGGAREG